MRFPVGYRVVLEATHLTAINTCLLSIGTYMISVVGTCMTALAYLATEMSNCNHRVSYYIVSLLLD